ncbi:MAG: hypothetical protein M3552_13435 [Planctomycetota bacterium]|nr:hypothetical protein [Planctomycetaceae bacterium]MDQ3331635.1 hypothetical protein [Planctomycetota bacterium]
MTTDPTATTSEPLAAPPSPFGAEEMQDLDREDVEAGRVIAWLLCFFFLYTIVVMSIAAWWTWDAIRS